MAVLSRGDMAELLELVDAALDEVSLLVFALAEGDFSILFDFGRMTGVQS